MTVDRLGTEIAGGIVSRRQLLGKVNGDFNALVFQVAKLGNLNAKDADGLALIHYAACLGDLSLIRKLYELGADMSMPDDGSPPWKPIHYAILHRQHEAEQVLKTFGVEPPLPILHRVVSGTSAASISRSDRPTLTIRL